MTNWIKIFKDKFDCSYKSLKKHYKWKHILEFLEKVELIYPDSIYNFVYTDCDYMGEVYEFYSVISCENFEKDIVPLMKKYLWNNDFFDICFYDVDKTNVLDCHYKNKKHKNLEKIEN